MPLLLLGAESVSSGIWWWWLGVAILTAMTLAVGALFVALLVRTIRRSKDRSQ